MKQIRTCDVTMKQAYEDFRLSFKEKIELSKLLDKLGVDVIELEGISNVRIDSLRIKSIAATVSESAIAVPVQLNDESIENTCLDPGDIERLTLSSMVFPLSMEATLSMSVSEELVHDPMQT